MTLAAGVLVVQTVRGGDTAPVASAAAQLNSAADRVDVRDTPIEPGQYRYIASRGWGMTTYMNTRPDGSTVPGLSFPQEGKYELWVPAGPTRKCTPRSGPTGNYRWVVGDDERQLSASVRQDVIVDPATGHYIGARDVALDDSSGVPAGTVTGYSSVAPPVVVDDVGDTSAG